MTERTKEVFEKYGIRKNKAQKARFREFATQYAMDEGYAVNVEKNKKAKNIVVGNPKDAKVIYTAHYDTPAGTPFPNLVIPKCIPLYILYQILICVMLYTVPVLMMTLIPKIITSNGGSGVLSLAFIFGGYTLMLIEIYLLINGPANKNNRNDNTSGVSVLFELMKAMPEEKRDSVAFIFFDLEERGTRGSAEYRKKHRRWANKIPVINFDCVGDGNNILVVVGKKAQRLESSLCAAFVGNDMFSCEVASKGVFYPSDQRNFDLGIGVGAFNKTKSGILYADKIHTKRDLVCNDENISYLVECSIRLIETLDLTTKVAKQSHFSKQIELAKTMLESETHNIEEAPTEESSALIQECVDEEAAKNEPLTEAPAEEVSEPKAESVSIADEAEPETEEENIPDNAPEAEAKESEE